MGYLEDQLGAGAERLSDIAYGTAHSQEALNDLNGMQQQILGRAAGTEDQDWNNWAMGQMANGASMADMRNNVAHSDAATSAINALQQFLLGRTSGQYDQAYDQWAENAMGQYTDWTLNRVRGDIAQSDAPHTVINAIYTDWGQTAPDAAALQTAGTALYNLSLAWSTVQNQSADQLNAEAAAYTPTVSVSFQDQISNLASSLNQAVSVEANLLVNTYLESTADPDDARNLMQAGGENALGASLDEALVLTELQKIENENTDDCDPVAFRSDASIVKNISNETIKAANQTFGDVNGTTWDQSYKDQGIQWKSKGSGTSANQQGLPYEAWVQHQLNPSQDPNGVIWLQAEKANWKTFDHWDEKNRIATSDKTINLAADSYRNRPYAVAARVMASVDKILGYDQDDENSPAFFRQTNISSYTLDLAVPYITDPETMDDQTRAEWKALCRAYHDAMSKVPAASGKSLTVNINPVS